MSGHEVEELPGRRGDDGEAARAVASLLHREVEVSFDDAVRGKVFLSLWLRAAAVAFGVLLLFCFVGLITLAGDPQSGLGIMGIGLQIAMIAFVAVFLASRTAEPVGEWRVLLDGEAEEEQRAESAYAGIARAVRERRLPVEPVFRRIRTAGAHPRVTHRMVLRDGSYVAYLSVFAYGSSVYLGWVMWRSRRGTEVVGRVLADFAADFGGADPEKAAMRAEAPRALREALHAAALEGLSVAVDGCVVAPEAGFPQGLPPVEEEDAVAAPLPAQAAAPAPMAPPPVPPRKPWAKGGK
ncbi:MULTISPECIES: hypothetical protein [unclassified Streptomyces]|uniref:hypothetical protein n=1 Tax=unclassified Streptomyces TaxID=2593676 RepID=UPI0025524AC7|nr:MULTISPECIES: hypothetical protein [unclassified Streptomyces]WRZ65770.1 hypothetical protein OG408_18595 [Streptomyces sp. NBC_01257]